MAEHTTTSPRARGTQGRKRVRKPGKSEGAPFVSSIARRKKRTSGKAGKEDKVLGHIHVSGAELSDDNRTYIRRKLGAKLGKFKRAIERATVRVEDVNGPHGGIDQVCRIKVVLTGLPSVVVEGQDSDLAIAIDTTLKAVERAVWRSMQRRQMKPMRWQRRGRVA